MQKIRSVWYQEESDRELRERIQNSGEKKKQKCDLEPSALLALITTFQQNYRNYQLAVTPKKVGLYCRVPLNDPLPFLSGLSPVLGFS